jgi:hypothetical protein
LQLKSITVELFRNIVSAQTVDIEPDVTCLVGKNESGKTAALHALHRLNPANGAPDDNQFDLTIDYPRWRLSHDRRATPDLASATAPIRARFELNEADRARIGAHVPAEPPEGTVCNALRTYANAVQVSLRHDLVGILRSAALESSVAGEDLDGLLEADSIQAAQEHARARSKEVREEAPLRAKALTAFATAAEKYSYLTGAAAMEQAAINELWAMVPKTFYFASYDLLPGEADLTELAELLAQGGTPKRAEQTVLALLRHAGEEPTNFLDENYASRKAELQAASSDLTQHVFRYWRQNTDLEVIFDDDNVSVGKTPQGADIMHRRLMIEIRDGRHGGVETNFSTRSTGFQWFFSFFAAFSEYQASESPLVVLLDEPGTSLHGEAQQDFVRYVFDELGASKQTLYTTHSQHMVDPTRYEKLRAVHDRATRENANDGVAITRVDLSADRGTILPVESALGYSVSQHLFLGSGHHLAVEGSSDFMFLMRVSEHLDRIGRTGLDPRFSIIPVGGADNMPAFVALMGRRLKVTALIDGAQTSRTATRCRNAAAANDLPDGTVVTCGEAVAGLPATADIEDLFEPDDYLKLYRWAFQTALTGGDLAATGQPLLRRLDAVVGAFDHALPAHALTEHRREFFETVSATTLDRFVALFTALNATLA